MVAAVSWCDQNLAHRSGIGRREDPIQPSSFAEPPELGPLAFCVRKEDSMPKPIILFVLFTSPKDAFRAVKKRIVGNKNFHEVMLALTVSLSIHPSMISHG